MKLHIANHQPDRRGGGWTQARYLAEKLGHVSYEECDTYLIMSASVVEREQVKKAKDDGKRIVLRVDNVLRNSRNRNTGMSRMYDFAQWADLVVYQSTWAMETLSPFLKKEGVVILNACDTDVFNPKGRQESEVARYLYSRVNRDETKNWEMARHIYSTEHRIKDKKTLLNLVGAYSPELVEYNFDFYNGEDYRFWGEVDQAQLADIYRMSDYLIFTFFNDACSNTLIEALCSGCEVLDPYGMSETGGSGEILHYFEDHGGAEYFKLDRMVEDYKKVL